MIQLCDLREIYNANERMTQLAAKLETIIPEELIITSSKIAKETSDLFQNVMDDISGIVLRSFIPHGVVITFPNDADEILVPYEYFLINFEDNYWEDWAKEWTENGGEDDYSHLLID